MKTSFGRSFIAATMLSLLAVPGLAQVTGWGTSESYQLLNFNTTNASPIALSGIGSPIALAAGSTSVYALNADGTVLAWGNNSGNQLAKANDGQAGSPPDTIQGLPPVAKVFASSLSGFAITPTGTLWAWGYNGYGELGIGSTTNAVSPAIVGEVGPNAKVIGGDSRVLVLKEDGTLYGAGYNYYYDLGLGDRAARSTFTQIGLTGVKSAAFGGLRSGIAATADGNVYTWGAYLYGDTYATPTLQAGLSGIVKVAGVPGAAYAIDASGTVYSWGSNDHGILGRPTANDEETPTAIPGLPPIAEVVGARGGTAYALGRDGSVWAWGSNAYGTIGDGTSTDRYVPVRVAGLAGVNALSAGRNFVLARTTPAQTVAANLQGFTLLETSTKGYRNVRARITLDNPAGPGGFKVNLASRQAGNILPTGLPAQSYNGLTLSDVPSPRPTLKKVWRVRNRTNSTHAYLLLMSGATSYICGSVPPNSDAYFVSNTQACLNASILLDDTLHLSLDTAGNAVGPVPTNVFASASLPAFVTVPEGATTFEFDVFANEVPVDATVELVANQGAITKIAALKILLESAKPTP